MDKMLYRRQLLMPVQLCFYSLISSITTRVCPQSFCVHLYLYFVQSNIDASIQKKSNSTSQGLFGRNQLTRLRNGINIIFYMILLFVLLLGRASAAKNYTTATSSFSWSGMVISNKGSIPFQQPPLLPYQIIEDVAPNQVRGYFDYTNSNASTNKGAQHIDSFNARKIRADSDQVHNFQVDFTMFGTPLWYKLTICIHVTRYNAVSQTSATKYVVITLAKYNTGGCESVGTSCTIAGAAWLVSTQSYGYCLQPVIVPSAFNGTVVFSDFMSFLVTSGRLNKYDVQLLHHTILQFGGAGYYSMNVLDSTPSTVKSTMPGEYLFGSSIYDNLQYVPNLYSADYLNATYVYGSTTASSLTVDFLYTRNALNAYPRVYFGYVNGKWYTPNAGYNFPISADDSTTSLEASFFYSQADAVQTKKAACIGLTLRNDYNPLTQVYANSSSIYPSKEIQVCGWWSPTLSRTGSLWNVTLGGQSYEMCLQNSSSSDNLTAWPVYIFVANANTLSVTNLNMQAFANYIHTNVSSLSLHYVTGAYFGFRIYTGKGNFIYLTDPVLTRKITTAPTPLAETSPDLNSPLLSLLEQRKLMYEIILNIFSFPSGTLLLQLSPIVIVLDDYSYYAYHNARYDNGFKVVVEFCWSLNNDKWIPPFLNDAYQKLQENLASIQIKDWAQVTPQRFLFKGETVYFLNNAQDYLFSSLPLTASSFFLFWLLRRKIKSPFVRSFLQPFSTCSYLLSALIGDNIQYLSFRCFQQLRFIAPNSKLELTSIAMALVVLNAIVIAGVSMYSLLWRYDKGRFCLDSLKPLSKSYLLMTITLVCRLINGFAHAFLDDPQLQTAVVLAVNIAILLVTCKSCFTFKLKRDLACYISILFLKCLVGVLLVLQTSIHSAGTTMSTIEGIFRQLTTMLLCIIAVLFILQYLITKGINLFAELLKLLARCNRCPVRKPKRIIKRIRESCPREQYIFNNKDNLQISKLRVKFAQRSGRMFILQTPQRLR